MPALIKNAIAKGLFGLECRAPRFKTLSQGIARFLGKDIAERVNDFRQWSDLCLSMRKGPDPSKVNCWEFSSCCKEVHGKVASVLGVCPASLESRLDGIHGGRNGGRACWVVPSTLCHGSEPISAEQKKKNCEECGFFTFVQWEEGVSFIRRTEVLDTLLR